MVFTPDIAGLDEVVVCDLYIPPPIEPPDTKPGSAVLLLAYAVAVAVALALALALALELLLKP